MSEPIVTAVVPVYNSETYIRQCLDALAAQTLEDIRIICVNDGSTDTSPDITAEYATHDPRFELINKKNAGYGAALNTGFAAATTKYVGNVDPDDIPSIEMFEKLVALAERTEADIVRSNYYRFIDDGEKREEVKLDNFDPGLPCETGFSPKEYHRVLWGSASIWSAIYRREFLDAHNIRLFETPGVCFQDTSFNLIALMTAERVAFTREAFVHYRTDNPGSSSNSGAKVFCICDEYHQVWNYLRAHPDLYQEFAKDVAVLSFRGYCWNLYRMAPQFREQFAERMFVEFNELERHNLIDTTLFSEWEQMDLNQLLHDYGTFLARALNAADA